MNPNEPGNGTVGTSTAPAFSEPGTGATHLIGAERSLRVEDWSAHAPEGAGTPWSVGKRVLHGGRQEGVDVLDVDNGRLRFAVVPTRGMSIHRLDMGDIRLGWDSPVREIVHPSLVDLAAMGAKGWLAGFNEWLPRCGLAFAGHPGEDGGEMLTLHGRIGNIPASELTVEIDPRTEPGRIVVTGTVHEATMFGPNLALATEIATEMGSDTLRIVDTITNLGSSPQEFQLLYHSNYGEPLLEDGARFVAPERQVRPFDDHAARSLGAGYARYGGPRPGFREEVFGVVPFADEAGMTEVMLRNAAGDKGVSIRYSTAELPCFTLWKNTGAAGEAYVTGLEPGTSYPANRSVERRAGRVPVLQPGETRSFALEFAVLAGAQAVREAEARIAALAAGREPEFLAETIKAG